jgi:hypothetical protein
MMVEAGADHPGVPALSFFRHSKGPSSEPQTQWIYFSTVATICILRRNQVADCIFDYFAETMSPMYYLIILENLRRNLLHR